MIVDPVQSSPVQIATSHPKHVEALSHFNCQRDISLLLIPNRSLPVGVHADSVYEPEQKH